MSNEVVKLQKHLALLREEYVKLQSRHTDLERKYNLLNSIHGTSHSDAKNNDGFIARLLRTISDLFNKELYSDLTIRLNDCDLKAHKFVLDARSKKWSTQSLSTLDELDLTDLPQNIGFSLIKWVYTDIIENKTSDENFYLDMMRQASKFELRELKEKCEESLVAFVSFKNCIKFYEVAEEISANTLKQHCNELISHHWNDFTCEDFAHMSASLLYKLIKSKTTYPLHACIKAKREDVVFLYLIEHDSILKIKLNEPDENNELPLDLALQTKQESIAINLVRNHADVNKSDRDGLTLLHKSINRNDEYSSIFLVDNGAKLNQQTHTDRKTPLILLSSMLPFDGMLNIAQKILSNPMIDVDIKDSQGNTCLHCAILAKNEILFKEILKLSVPNMCLKNEKDETPLWLALLDAEKNDNFSVNSFASQLIDKGCPINECAQSTGESLISVCAKNKLEKSAIFLVNKGAEINLMNEQGESVLHFGCEQGLYDLVKLLLEKEANTNIQTKSNSQTPMHRAVSSNNELILDLFIDYTHENSKQEKPNFDLKDANGQTVLSLCIWNNMFDAAKKLIEKGANVNACDNEGIPLLHQAILRQSNEGSLFLLNQRQVNLNLKSCADNLSPLQLAIKRHLPLVVENLCKKGADMSILDAEGNSPLWNALDSGQEDIAYILVNNGCDTTQWSTGPGNCSQTILHRAIDENNESVAVFLIRSGCDINSPRRLGAHGECPDEARDMMTPLHLACTWGQEKVVIALVEYGADLNIQDCDGNTPLHLAIQNQHISLIEILVKHPLIDLTITNGDAQKTPFAVALEYKNNKAAQIILKREPKAAEQFDNKGRNFLHSAIIGSDIEIVLLLLAVNVNINSRTKDNQTKTPLHLAVEIANEMILRNLLLAGANINDLTAQKKNALHLIAESCHPLAGSIAHVLLENKIDYNVADSMGNNALHIAVQYNNLAIVKVLLAHSNIDVYAINSKGLSPIHVLGIYGKESSSAMLESFMQTIKNFAIDQRDSKGNTCLLLAYQNGNGNLCRSLVKYGAALATYNDDAISIFNYPVATKQLLLKLLDIIQQEPPWIECDTCLECKTKFTLTVRKHHCRHCGRVLCKKCSEKEISILKFGIQKPVRVCSTCFDVLTVASGVQLMLK